MPLQPVISPSLLEPEPVEQLLPLAEALMSTDDPEIVLDTVTRVGLELFAAEACSLSLYEKATDELAFFVSQGSAKVEPFRISARQGIAGHVFQTGKTYLVNDTARDRHFFSGVDRRTGHRTRSILCCPLGRPGERLGTLQALNTRRTHGFSRADEKLINVLAALAAVALERVRTARALRSTQRAGGDAVTAEHPLVRGTSHAMAGLLSTLEKASRSRATILLLGESGVGKEVAARAVHDWSCRRQGPFVVINCAALSPQLLESELFGHERGAFTGALSRKRGRFELADGGTLFLDEIGELAPDLQAKLLRALQDGELQRVGGTETLRPNVRVIAATNRDLARDVTEHRFRLDLYYRLRVIAVSLPPLRERPEDIAALAQHFLRRCALEQERMLRPLSAEMLEVLAAYAWPGNVRELSNVIERAVVLTEGDEITLRDLPQEIFDQRVSVAAQRPSAPRATVPLATDLPAGPLSHTLATVKRRLIEATLAHYGGNQVQAAAHLGLHPSNLSRALKQLGMR